MKTEKQFPVLTDFQITETMQKNGGAFVSRLGQLFRYADDANKAILKEAFKDYWDAYANATARCPECGQTDIMRLPEYFQCEDCNHQWGQS